jgi:hypothetical protein
VWVWVLESEWVSVWELELESVWVWESVLESEWVWELELEPALGQASRRGTAYSNRPSFLVRSWRRRRLPRQPKPAIETSGPELRQET